MHISIVKLLSLIQIDDSLQMLPGSLVKRYPDASYGYYFRVGLIIGIMISQQDPKLKIWNAVVLWADDAK